MTIVAAPIPNVSTLVKIAEEIRELERTRTRLIADLVADCAFMDTPTVSLVHYDVRGKGDARPGDVFHIVRQLQEFGGGYEETRAHPAATCAHEWCQAGETVKWPKHSHVGRRTFWTRQNDHVLAGVETVRNSGMFGPQETTMYTFVPVSIERVQ
ncbi:hypothetical protein [Microbacterium paulum]